MNSASKLGFYLNSIGWNKLIVLRSVSQEINKVCLNFTTAIIFSNQYFMYFLAAFSHIIFQEIEPCLIFIEEKMVYN